MAAVGRNREGLRHLDAWKDIQSLRALKIGKHGAATMNFGHQFLKGAWVGVLEKIHLETSTLLVRSPFCLGQEARAVTAWIVGGQTAKAAGQVVKPFTVLMCWGRETPVKIAGIVPV